MIYDGKYEIFQPDPPGLLDTTRGKLVDFHPQPLDADKLIGRTVLEISDHVGSYGMGGPGFFGLRFDKEWLVVAIWGADEWITAEGQRMKTHVLSKRIVGQAIATVDLAQEFLVLKFEDGFDLTVENPPSVRTHVSATGYLRVSSRINDLREGVFFSPTDRLLICD